MTDIPLSDPIVAITFPFHPSPFQNNLAQEFLEYCCTKDPKKEYACEKHEFMECNPSSAKTKRVKYECRKSIIERKWVLRNIKW